MLGSVDKTELGYYAAAAKLSEICDFWRLIIAALHLAQTGTVKSKQITPNI